MARSYTVSFNITGAMDGSLLSAIQSAQNALKGLNRTARAASNASKLTGLAGVGQSLNAIQQAATKFRKLKKAAAESQQALANAQKQAGDLARQSKANAKAVDELRQKFSDLSKAQSLAQKERTADKSNLTALRNQLKELKAAYAEAKKLGDTAKMAGLTSAINSTGAALQAQQAKIKATAQAYKELADKIKKTKSDLRAAESAAASSGKGFDSARSQAASLKASLQSQLEALQRLRSQLGAAGFNTSNFAASERALQSEIDRVNQSLQRQQQLLQARQNFRAAFDNMSNAYSEFQNSLQTAQTFMTPFQDAAQNAMTFEKAMSRLKALTQMRNLRAGNMAAVEREMASMTETIERLGATSEFTANQIAGAANYYAMSGWTPEQINAMLPTTTNLASIALIPIDRAADMLSDDMTAFGIKAGQSYKLAGGKLVDGAQYFGDAVAYATTQANMDFSTFHEAWKYNAPTAHAMNLTLGEAIAQNMVAANAGIKGSMAGTSFRQFWVRLSAPPKTAQKSMEEMGMTASDATKTIREMQEAMAEAGVDQSSDLFAKIEALEQYYQSGLKAGRDMTGWLKGLTGQTALSGVQSLFDTGKIDEAKRYAHEIDSGFIEGWATDTAAVMRDNTQTAIDYLTSAADALQRSAGQALLPAIRSVAEAFTPLITSAAQWVAQNPAIVQACAAIATSLSGIIISAAAVKLAFAGWGFITSAITLVRTALAGLGSGAILGGLIGRIAALRTALFGLGGAATLGGWSAMFAAIATSARTATTAVTRFFASLSLSSMASGAIAALRSVGTAILGAARAAMMFAFSPVGVALMALALAGLYCYQNWDKVAPVLSNIANIITGSLSGALQTIAPAIENVMSAFGNLFNVLGSSGILSQIGMLVTGVLATIATTIAGVLSTIINVAATIISTVANVISGIINLISNLISGNWAAAWENAKSIAVAAVEGIRDVIKGILDGITSTIENVGKAWSFITGKAPSSESVKGTTPTATTTTAIVPETTPIDTTTTQAALDAVGDAAQNAATNMEGVQQATDAISQIPASIQPTTEALTQFPQSLQPTTDALAQFPASLEPVTSALADFPSSLEPVTSALEQMAEGMTEAVSAMSNALIQLGADALTVAAQLQTDTVALQAFGAATVTDTVALQMLGAAALATFVAIQMLGAAALATFVAIQMLGAAALGAYKGVADLGEAASGAAGKVAGLGEAARSACAQLAAAGANAAAQVSAAASSIKVGSNAEGGIYQRGAFLTTFAEKSPEAAIPLNHSKRAQDLWTQTGQLLGILPNDGRQPNWSIKRVPRIGGLKMPRINFPTMTPPTFPTTPDDIQPQIRRMPRGLKMPRINFPQMTPPTFPEERQMPRLSIPQGGGDLPPINVTIHVTITGNADEQVVRRGIESAMPTMQRSFAEELAAHRREALRRSFA